MSETEVKQKTVNKEEEYKDALWRVKITFSVIILCAVLGLPLWYATTSLYRAELPYQDINRWNNNLLNELHYEIPVYLDLPEPLQGMIKEAQLLIDDSLNKLKTEDSIDWKVVLKEGKGSNDDYKIDLQPVESEDGNGGGESFFISPFGKETKILLSQNVISHDKVPDFISKVVIDEMFPNEIDFFYKNSKSQDDMTVSFSPNYHVTISLLVGGGNPVTWDIEYWSHIFTNYLKKFNSIAEFSFDSKLDHYEVLSESVANHLQWNNDTQSYILLPQDTSTFIDYSAWGLDQNTDIAPTINFIAYIPSPENSPLQIEGSASNSFIVPQWGGVQIINVDHSNSVHLTQDTLIPLLETFASQLLHLLGGDITKPKSLDIRIDSLTRMKSFKNLREAVNNLVSLVKLTNQLPTISIPDSTLSQVEKSLSLIEKSIRLVNEGKWKEANLQVNEAAVISDKAFFQKDMVQQMYFPDEHKMAVYVPLLGPIGIIIFLGFIRGLKEIKIKKNTQKK